MLEGNVLEVLECEFKAIKERLLQEVSGHLWQLVDWMLDNSYRHVVISEIHCWLDYVKSIEDEEVFSEKTRDLIKRLNENIYDGFGLLEGVISYWIMSEIMTFDMDTLEDIMTELLKDVEERR